MKSNGSESDNAKLEILSEVGVGGASVTQVAQRHEITRSHIYGWWRALKRKRLWGLVLALRRFLCAHFIEMDVDLPAQRTFRQRLGQFR